jgi:hypothetical protein
MADLKSRRLIVLKGWMFLAIAVISGLLLFARAPTLETAALIAILVWASCRSYYFLFYVLEKYVDPGLRYRGLWHLIGQIRDERKARSGGVPRG